MTPEEIKRKYDDLKIRSRGLIDIYNNFWEEQEMLKSEYKRQTGKDIFIPQC